jgi:hypothetical protein
MNIGWKSAGTSVALALTLVLGAGCQQMSALSTAPRMTHAMAATAATPASDASENGAAGQMPAFYDGRQIVINVKQVPDPSSDPLTANNPNLNTIFVTNDLDDPQDFEPVVDAIQGDGFNPIWKQIRIEFHAGATPHQFHSDDEVVGAAGGAHPEISLVDTGELYRCAVVGKK